MAKKTEKIISETTPTTTPTTSLENSTSMTTSVSENSETATGIPEKVQTTNVTTVSEAKPSTSTIVHVPTQMLVEHSKAFDWQKHKHEHPKSMIHLFPQLPHLKTKLLQCEDPDDADLAEAMALLTETELKQVKRLIRVLSPSKMGMETGDDTLKPKMLKICHATSEDKLRPEAAQPGSLYIQGGQNLTLFNEKIAQAMKVPQHYTAAVLGMFYGRIFFPVKVNNNPVYPEPGMENLKGPICFSKDRKHGTRYNDCAVCDHRPASGKQECKDQVDVFIMPPDFSGIYRITVQGTAVASFASYIKNQTENWENAYECLFDISVAQEKNKKEQQCYVPKAKVTVSDKEPYGVQTTPGFRAMAQYFIQKIVCGWWLPELASSYNANFNFGKNEFNASGNNPALDHARQEAEDQAGTI